MHTEVKPEVEPEIESEVGCAVKSEVEFDVESKVEQKVMNIKIKYIFTTLIFDIIWNFKWKLGLLKPSYRNQETKDQPDVMKLCGSNSRINRLKAQE